MTEKLRLEWRDPATLTPNPRNFRRHPAEQKKLLAAVIDEVGWAGCILFNEATGRIIDGHARQEEAVRRKDAAVPVLVGNWTEQEEIKILATFDPIAAMAQQADDIYRELLADVETENEDLQSWCDNLLDELSEPVIVDNSGLDDDRGNRSSPGKGAMIVSIGTMSAVIDYDLVQSIMTQIKISFGDDELVKFCEWVNENLSNSS